MNKKRTGQIKEQFDLVIHSDKSANIEFWYARELMNLLGYERWENFFKAISRAMESCETSGIEVSNHFREVTKMVSLGSGARRSIKDFMLTRYACYLIAQNGDPKKEEIAFAQSYFAVQTRKQELIEERIALSERTEARRRLRESEKRFSQNIYERGVDDAGIKEFYSDSNGNIVHNPKYLEKSMRKLIREQRRLSRKQKGSGNRNKQRVKVALVHEKIANQRNDFLQKQSTMLVRENQTICIEDLNVKGMIRNHRLAKSIASAAWSKFFAMLVYKAVWYGNDVIKVPTMYPSSQTCSCCGYRNPLIKNLAVRNWECPECHTKHNRDTNASINILNKGLEVA